MTKLMKQYDVCIIGAGPAGLSVLSAITEPYSMDNLNDMLMNKANQILKNKRMKSRKSNMICVVDPHPHWLDGWQKNFDSLNIKFLRSPAMAHPDHFDIHSLLAYAIANNREDELIESGCFENKHLLSLGQTQIGLWKLPSTKLFHDFCLDLSTKLPHEYFQDTVLDISSNEKEISQSKGVDEESSPFIVKLGNGSTIVANTIVLAVGSLGKPIIPPSLKDVPKDLVFSWTTMKQNLNSSHHHVLVIGGGLTAVQAAQYALCQGKNVVLNSRRDLVHRHFDINEDWFDKRFANKKLSEFYHQEEDSRLSILRNARGGGSVPPIYMNDLEFWKKKGQLTTITSNVKVVEGKTNNKVSVIFHDHNTDKTKVSAEYSFDCIILACGIETDCNTHPLIKNIQKHWPCKVVGGFPCVSQDLEWMTKKNLYVVGALASLYNGPDSANLNGMRRSAAIIANALDCRSWLRRKETKVLSNPYSAFLDDDSNDSDNDSSGSFTSVTHESDSDNQIGFIFPMDK